MKYISRILKDILRFRKIYINCKKKFEDFSIIIIVIDLFLNILIDSKKILFEIFYDIS